MAELLDRLIGLAGDEVIDAEYQLPSEFLVALWRSDQKACSDLIRESVKLWRQIPFIADEIEVVALKLDDPRFLAVLKECAQLDAAPQDRRLALTSLLIRSGEESLIIAFARKFRKVVAQVEEGKLNPDRVDFQTCIKDICRLNLHHLVPELQRLDELYETSPTYIFHFETKVYVDAALLWFKSGIASVKEMAFNSSASVDVRAACAYCLGCARDTSLVRDLALLYRESSRRRYFDLRMACVEAIVYCARLEDADAFLLHSLQALSTSRNLRRWFYNADAGILLIAVYNMPTITEPLRNCAAQWLHATNEDVSVRALVALEKHGIHDDALSSALGRKYEINREVMKANPSPLMLMPFRPKY